MRNIYNLLLPALLVLLSSACTDIIIPAGTLTATEVKFTIGQITMDGDTRATDTEFEANDEIGIYMIRHGETLQPASNFADNKRYKISDTGELMPFSEADKIYPERGQDYDYFAYYPYTPIIENPRNMVIMSGTDQHVKANHKKSDFLLAQNTNVSGTSVTLNFKHKFSLLEICYQRTPGREISKAVMHRLQNWATADIQTGNVITDIFAKSDINLNQYAVDGNEYIYRVFVPAQQITPLADAPLFSFYSEETKETFRYNDKQNMSITAGQKNIYVIGQKYLIMAYSRHGDYGSVSGSGIYSHGQTVTVNVIPSQTYEFTGWYEANSSMWEEGLSLVSRDASYTFTALKPTILIADFKPIMFKITTFTTTTPEGDTPGGYTIGGGDFQKYAQHTVYAEANSGYEFAGWYENGELITANSSYTFMVNWNRRLEARFIKTKTVFTVQCYSNGSGYTEGAGNFRAGENCTLTAIAGQGYIFEAWYENSTKVSTNPRLSFTVTNDRVLTAKFIRQ